MWSNPQFSADLVAFTDEILNGKLPILWSGKLAVSPSLSYLHDCK